MILNDKGQTSQPDLRIIMAHQIMGDGVPTMKNTLQSYGFILLMPNNQAFKPQLLIKIN